MLFSMAFEEAVPGIWRVPIFLLPGQIISASLGVKPGKCLTESGRRGPEKDKTGKLSLPVQEYEKVMK
ncbi:hypothetical protein [Rhizobium sp. S96]|uniref:hypothetical protein n=1 Tax=Rhizobium sp. S96 TaxID=3055140 RepID=UPI0025AAD80D|nr:hypothetical protein [Rhizobium sp. S96]MDM9621667.1 hypothetical protein [Rhizobium sp. S96]